LPLNVFIGCLDLRPSFHSKKPIRVFLVSPGLVSSGSSSSVMLMTCETSDSQLPLGRANWVCSDSVPLVWLLRPPRFLVELGAGESSAAEAVRFCAPFCLPFEGRSGAPPIELWYSLRTSDAVSLKACQWLRKSAGLSALLTGSQAAPMSCRPHSRNPAT
jgi:hypothetical protein